jgi:hypothetical protein
MSMREMLVTPQEVLESERRIAAAIKEQTSLLPEKTAWNVTLEQAGSPATIKKIVAESFGYQNGTATSSFSAIAFFDQPSGKGNIVALINFNNMVSIEKIPKTGLPS